MLPTFEMPLELSEMTLEEFLRSYSFIKRHCTQCEKEISNLLQLLNTQYSSTSEERINDRLEKLEKYTHRLSDITEYLVTLKYAKARDHQEEVQEFSDVLDQCSNDIFTVLHNRHATAQAAANPVQPDAPCPSSKPSFLELKQKSSNTMLLLPPFGHGRSSTIRLILMLPKSFPFRVHSNKPILTIAWSTSSVPALTVKLQAQPLYTPQSWGSSPAFPS